VIAAFKRILRRLTPAEMAARELADAQLSLLEAQSAEDYARNMVSYHRTRITRLKTFLATETAAPSEG
jgi:hypothetical protein